MDYKQRSRIPSQEKKDEMWLGKFFAKASLIECPTQNMAQTAKPHSINCLRYSSSLECSNMST